MNTHEKPLPDTPLSPIAAAIVADIQARRASDKRVVVTRKVCQAMLGIASTRQIELETSGELPSYLEGSVRRVLLSAIYNLMIRRAIGAHPFQGPGAKSRFPASRFKRKPRMPSPQELLALKRANAERHLQAEARKAARKAARAKSQGAEEPV